MAGNTTNISIRMDAELKSQADELFAELERMTKYTFSFSS
jgi:antitoxin component of RelBE/YafQ-DinJ toxin-antitoxin module